MQPNVRDFLDKISKEVGNYEAGFFSQTVWCYCEEQPIESPIEQLFYIAFKSIIKFNLINGYDCENWNHIGTDNYGKSLVEGLYLMPQFKIGNYRVDFYISYGQDYNDKENILMINNKIIVECDSQEFHDRTEKERRYEKQRDRFLQKQGYKVFRFTGKEIIENPMRVAAEVYATLTDLDLCNIQYGDSDE